MEKAKLELAVGAFVLLGLICLGYLSLKLGKLEVLGGQAYELQAEFDSASGLKPGAAIEIAGVEIGRVKTISLRGDRASVSLAIWNGERLYSDAIASIKTRGIIGEKFVALSPGAAGDVLKPGGTIRDTESGLDLEQVISQFIHGGVK
jgi:phospholipid/cholesterol/gamma-HCH transport system substrate-binding protein